MTEKLVRLSSASRICVYGIPGAPGAVHANQSWLPLTVAPTGSLTGHVALKETHPILAVRCDGSVRVGCGGIPRSHVNVTRVDQVRALRPGKYLHLAR